MAAITTSKPALFALFTSLLLIGCGGGGGGDDEPSNALPQASFSVVPDPPQVGLDTTFDASGSTDPDGAIEEYLWQFGDGSSAQGARVSHRYETAGDLSVTLTAIDDQGGSAQSIQTLSVVQGFSLSGEVQVGGNIVTDGDINDPAAPFAVNDSAADAQSLPNPAIVNGFVSSSGSGQPGDRFVIASDNVDVYLVSVLKGQYVSLQLADFDEADPKKNDVDLYLYDSNMDVQGISQTYGEFESVVAAESGVAYIKVESSSGLNKYVLRIGNDPTSGRIAGPSTSADFIPNELVIRYRDDRGTAQALGVDTPRMLAAQHSSGRTVSGTTQLVQLGSIQRCHEVLEQISSASPVMDLLPQPRAGLMASAEHQDPLGAGNAKYVTAKLIKSLRERSDVAYAGPNYIVQPTRKPDDSYYYLQWHYPFISLPAAWDVTTGSTASEPVIVAVVDSGALLGHPDLAGQLVAGYDLIRDPLTAADGDGIDPNPDDVGDREGLSEKSSFHGSHVSGTIAAVTNNAEGVAGIGWGVKIMPVRTLGVGGGSGYDVMQGLLYAAGLANDSGTVPVRRADIVNLSLGCNSCYDAGMQHAISSARAAGVIVIAAAGNHSSAEPFYPAAYEGVVGVSALNSGSALAYYSNFGSYIDVTAPGGDDVDRNGDGYPDRILSTLGDDSTGTIEFRYGWSSGTSMASPHVAGVAALMKAVYPQLSPAQFDQAISSGAIVKDLGPAGRDDDFGFGMIDALKAVQHAQTLGGGPQKGTISANPTVLDFPQGFRVDTLHLTAQGSDAPDVVSVSGDQAWLQVEAGINVDAQGRGDYIVQVDRTTLETAVYQGKITVQLSEGDDIVVAVYMQVLNQQAGGGNPGLLYVLLRNDETMTVTHQTQVRADSDGAYRYHFDRDIGAGPYSIYAGSDVDNDRVICGTGETCGAWPTRDNVQSITVDRDLSGFDFELITDADFGVTQARLEPETAGSGSP